MNRNELTEVLKDYRSYEYAVRNLGHTPSGGGFRLQPFLNSDRLITANEWDHQRYTRIVALVEGAVTEVLNDLERDIIRMKYMDRNTLTIAQIADRNRVAERTVKSYHKRALAKLTVALRFVEAPEIHNLDHYLDGKSETWISTLVGEYKTG